MTSVKNSIHKPDGERRGNFSFDAERHFKPKFDKDDPAKFYPPAIVRKLKLKGLSANAKAVYEHLYRVAGNNNSAWWGYKKIGEALGVHANTVRMCVDFLRDEGFVEYQRGGRRPDSKKGRPNVYFFLRRPEFPENSAAYIAVALKPEKEAEKPRRGSHFDAHTHGNRKCASKQDFDCHEFGISSDTRVLPNLNSESPLIQKHSSSFVVPPVPEHLAAEPERPTTSHVFSHPESGSVPRQHPQPGATRPSFRGEASPAPRQQAEPGLNLGEGNPTQKIGEGSGNWEVAGKSGHWWNREQFGKAKEALFRLRYPSAFNEWATLSEQGAPPDETVINTVLAAMTDWDDFELYCEYFLREQKTFKKPRYGLFLTDVLNWPKNRADAIAIRERDARRAEAERDRERHAAEEARNRAAAKTEELRRADVMQQIMARCMEKRWERIYHSECQTCAGYGRNPDTEELCSCAAGDKAKREAERCPKCNDIGHTLVDNLHVRCECRFGQKWTPEAIAVLNRSRAKGLAQAGAHVRRRPQAQSAMEAAA